MATLEEYDAAEKYANEHPLDVDSLADNFRVQSWLSAWAEKHASKDVNPEPLRRRSDAEWAEGMIETLQQYY